MPDRRSLCNYCSVNTFYAFATLIDVASAWGPVHVAATAHGVAAVELLSTVDGFLAGLSRRGILVARDRAGAPAMELAAATADAVRLMLLGLPVVPDGLPVDIDDRPAWDRLVLGAVRAIPRGETVSYGEVARRIGRPGAARAVGGAVGRNPVGLLIPCHRVIAADGSLGGYGVAAFGGRTAALAVKRELLALEGVVKPTPRL
jgi:methylated-DNA-[protein]-cysteine S-methyltransferase